MTPDHGGLFRFRVTDSERFGPGLEPVAPGVSAVETESHRFSADVQAMSLKNLTLFSVRIEAARVCRTPEGYVAITVPLDHELRFYEGTECGGYPPGRAHILWAGKTLDLLIDEPSSLLVVTYPWPWMRDTCSPTW